ncbi:MAG: hypothetical protein Q9P14_17425 [candidate division KSB1 bacterium]|nr:hypothetical protein [candidate division KSB1 bacterium]MDQ7066160.1 hypothetical protein [candidate division KSB1 bacterium]
MGSYFELTRDLIRFKIHLIVATGGLEPKIAAVWEEAFNSLNDLQMMELMQRIEHLEPMQACKITLRYLMDHHYPFRELILYHTDDTFKRRMGLEQDDESDKYLH